MRARSTTRPTESAGPDTASSPDLYPAALRAEIDALNERVYQTVNNGTYQVAGATTQADYERLRQLLIGMFGELDWDASHHRETLAA